MITEIAKSTVNYMEKNLQVEAIGAIVIIALIILAAFSLVFLVCRSVRLWYWKINVQLKALENIDKSLDELKRALPETATVVQKQGEILTELENSDDFNSCKIVADTVQQDETIQSGETDGMPKLYFDNRDTGDRTLTELEYNVGKTGTVYAEERLREQIQF